MAIYFLLVRQHNNRVQIYLPKLSHQTIIHETNVEIPNYDHASQTPEEAIVEHWQNKLNFCMIAHRVMRTQNKQLYTYAVDDNEARRLASQNWVDLADALRGIYKEGIPLSRSLVRLVESLNDFLKQ